MKVIDCFGDICPIPVLKIEEELSKSKSGDEFMLVVDHSCVVESIRNKYKDRNLEIVIEEVMNGVWEISFKIL